jgi:Eco57I restriction-modification methylase
VRAEHPKAFDDLVWPLLQHSGDAYIYPAMLKGVDATYPPDITNGLDTEAPDLLARRKPWNKRADEPLSLPTEIWRETIARHQRTREVRAKIAAGDLKDVGDLITYNLDIRQFAQDLIERCIDVALLKSFWFALAGRLPRKSNEKFRHGLSVLDPTCGSGAFLFAALNILKPLYDATLRTLQAVRTDALIANEKSSPEKWAEVDELLARFAAAGSERAQDYQVIKHIIVNNLYGVDIEEQATEIAKLRLFLKLVALLEPGDDIEPLPDIDFNIRHGNTLVGYATADETEKAVKGAKQVNLFSDAWEDIRIRLTAVEQQYNNFQIQQVQRGGHVAPSDKQALVDTLAELEEMLNYHLAREYGINTTKTADYEEWKLSHQPFHWYVDFYPLIVGGGFDAIIGNPPYLEYSKIREEYAIRAPKIDLGAGNLYAFTTERSLDLLRPQGAIGLIVPVSIVSTQRMAHLQQRISNSASSWFSNYGERPAKLFSGAEVLLTIVIAFASNTRRTRYVTGLRKWNAEQREQLFATTGYVVNAQSVRGFVVPKFSSNIESSGFLKIWFDSQRLGTVMSRSGSDLFYRIGGGRYWKIFTTEAPKFSLNNIQGKSSRESTLTFTTDNERLLACALLSSSIFFWFFSITTNGRDLNPIDLQDFPVDLNRLGAACPKLLAMAPDLMADYQLHSRLKIKQSTQTGLVEYQEFYPRLSKSLIDDIDIELGRFYKLSSEELDYIINYDIKYRMGQGMEDNDD